MRQVESCSWKYPAAYCKKFTQIKFSKDHATSSCFGSQEIYFKFSFQTPADQKFLSRKKF